MDGELIGAATLPSCIAGYSFADFRRSQMNLSMATLPDDWVTLTACTSPVAVTLSLTVRRMAGLNFTTRDKAGGSTVLGLVRQFACSLFSCMTARGSGVAGGYNGGWLPLWLWGRIVARIAVNGKGWGDYHD